MSQVEPDIDSSLREARVFEPPSSFSRNAHIKSREEYDKIYERSVRDPEGFWSEIANELEWFSPWTSVLEWDEPFSQMVRRRADQYRSQLS